MKSGLAVAAIILAIWGCTYCIHRGIAAWRQPDYRTRNDRVAADRISRTQPTPEIQAPGTDTSLYLDCIAIYGDCQDLDRLRNAINQHRKEKPQP